MGRASRAAGTKGLIETSKLTRRFGSLTAVKELDLQVAKGDVFGFIGPNGAGKTTTLRILATLLKPTYGEAKVGGFSVWGDARRIRGLIGYMPDFFGTYENMRVADYLEFFAAAYRIEYRQRGKIVENVLDLTDLKGKRDAPVLTLSRGMQQRLGLARVLLHDPELLILDEPASGLDPRARIEIRALLKELHNLGKTIVISSHILSELEEFCTRVGIIEQGNLLYSGTIDELKDKAGVGGTYEVRLESDAQQAAEALKQAPHILSVEVSGDVLTIKVDREAVSRSYVSKLLAEKGFAITYYREAVTLESVFMGLTKGLVA
ncbi:MAG TPA: ABC transporter ATP-binding protein [Candidatus Brocadiia bacterium]|nr:ABC transporter ATP-binding protein [Candidatus Brocadiia bacterium]